MLWKRGWLLDSLKYRVEKDLQDTLFKNDTFSRYRWSLLERLIVWGSKHIFIANLILAVWAILIGGTISASYAHLKKFIPMSISGLKPILEFQSTLFGTQITILGLIFPLVIAFIGILLQGKSSNKSMWVVYRHNSGFMLVGFSALTLTAYFVILKLLEPWLTHQSIVASAISITSWFSLNLFVSGWFLWKTVRFLSLDDRMEMVVKYAINEVIVSDIRRRLRTHHHVAATQTGLLSKSDDEKFKITTFSFKDLPYQVKQNHSEPKSVINVWYRLLRVGVWFWSVQARFLKSTDDIPVLCFPFHVDGHKNKTTILAKADCIRVNFMSTFFIRKAIRLSAKTEKVYLDIEQMVGALFGQIEDSLKDNNSRLFESAKDDLVGFHKEIISSMHFINDSGEPDNWILLSDGQWLGNSFLNTFIREATGISKSVTRKIQDDADFFESWCYLYPRNYSWQNTDMPSQIGLSYINGHYYIWGSLMSWIGGYNSADKLSNQQRDRAIKHFVGSWEYWRDLIDIDFNSVTQASFDYALQHLANTSCMIVYATKYENFYAARWATDMFIYWYELFSNHEQGYRYYGWHHELLTPMILKEDITHKLRDAIFKGNEFDEPEATSIALRNYWLDLRCLTAAYLMGSSQYRTIGNYKEYVNSILSCKRLEPTGNIEINHAQLLNAKDLLSVYLRQHGCWECQQSYSASLGQHVDNLARIEEPEWVSGRIYSSRGTGRDSYLPSFFKVIGIGFTQAEFKLDKNWTEFLKSDAVTQRELESTTSNLKTLIEVDDTILESVCFHFNVDIDEAKRRQDLFVKSINDIVSDLESEIANQIINAKKDVNRLIEYGILASGSAFNITDGPIPISLFQDVEYTDDFSSDLVDINIIDYHKSKVAEGLDVNRTGREGSWLSDIIEKRVSMSAFQQLFRELPWREMQFFDILALLQQVVEDSKHIKGEGLTPMMFVGPWNVYRRIDASRWQYAREEEKLPFDIAVESGRPNTYICHLAGIEIHRLPFFKADYSVLLPKEAYRKVKVKRFGDGRYVDVDFKTDTETDLTGTLTLSFGIECEYRANKCFKYISLHPDDD